MIGHRYYEGKLCLWFITTSLIKTVTCTPGRLPDWTDKTASAGSKLSLPTSHAFFLPSSGGSCSPNNPTRLMLTRALTKMKSLRWVRSFSFSNTTPSLFWTR